MNRRPLNDDQFESNFGLDYDGNELIFQPLEAEPYEELQREFEALEDEELGQRRHHRATRQMMSD